MANRVLEMAIAIKGQLDSSVGGAMTKAIAQTKQMQAQIRAANREMTNLQKQAAKQQASKGYVEYDTELAMLQAQVKKNQAAKEYEATMDRVNAKQKASANLSSAVSNLKAGAVAAAAVAAPLGLAVNEAIKFESTMADVRKTVDFDTPEQFKQMGDDILKMSQEMPMSAEGIAKIVAAAGQAGIAKDELKQFATDAIKMGVAFDTTAEQAGTMMANWRTAFGMSQTQVVELADQINYLSNTTNASSDAISDIVTRVGPLGDVAGISAAQIAAIGASMTAAGVKSEVAATGIKNLAMGLVLGSSATKQQQEAFAQLGLSAEDVAKRMQTDAQGTIMDVLTRIKQLPKEAQAGALKNIFGEESIEAIAPLLTQLDNLKANFNKVSDATQYAGSTEAEYQARVGTTANQLTLAKNNLVALAVNIGGLLLPAVSAVAGGLAMAMGSVAKFVEEHQTLASVILGTITAVIGLTMAALGIRAAVAYYKYMAATINMIKNAHIAATIATKASAAATFIAAAAQRAFAIGARIAAVAQMALNAVMAMNPFTLLVIAIMIAVAALVYLWNTNESFRAACIAAWESICAAVSSAWDTISSAAAAAWDYITSAVSGAYDFIVSCFDSISAAAQAVWDAAVSAAQSAWDSITSAVDAGVQWCIDKWEGLKEAFSHPIDAVVNFIKGGDSDAASAAGQSASGGVFSHPYLTWVAEAGYPEVIVPITHDANAYNLWATAGQMLGVGPAAMPTMTGVPASAPTGGAAQITFAPTINVQGGGPGTEQRISQLMDQKMREFDSMMKRWAANQRRLSYE
ncbi:phage tail tape measure protein, TP901 family, core region [Megasphaera elsdenii]|uniref:phage tail tape measure protein n=1 Tax=Megasphaera elsdenii TaxID=907 RepID=UPI0008EACDEA|nr:phage tail tape measure protein [Megasphaera elsdenii]SFH78813.1 phage tail tape measure protein, TP901 family, core region [Megasphaera elsdenii]